MNIHEFQGKDIFRKFGIPVPTGRAAKSPAEAQQIATELGGPVWVVKAQIHAGGRGKGTLKEAPTVHGVHITKSVEAATKAAEQLLGNTLVTHQTGPAGQVVKQVLVEQGSAIARELYVGTVLDSDTSKVTFIISTEGGMDIEEVAANTPEKIITIAVDPTTGVMPYHTRRIAKALGLTKPQGKQAAVLFRNLYQAFINSDASLVEINPLVVTTDGDLIALDAKLTFDSNALFRRPEIAGLRDKDEEDPKEQDASEAGLSYVTLDGNIGCLVNGAGLAMATMDIIKNVGGAPANFLDVGGSATTEQVTTAFKIILADDNVRAILVNIFGGIAKCDTIANGIIAAAQEVGLSIPLIVRLAGTNVDLGKKILAESGLTIQSADDMLDAATKAVQAAGVAS